MHSVSHRATFFFFSKKEFASQVEIFDPLSDLSVFILGQQAMDDAPDLMSKDSRTEWETAFSNSVVAPVLKVCGVWYFFLSIIIFFDALSSKSSVQYDKILSKFGQQ